jgi:hypothetical protein
MVGIRAPATGERARRVRGRGWTCRGRGDGGNWEGALRAERAARARGEGRFVVSLDQLGRRSEREIYSSAISIPNPKARRPCRKTVGYLSDFRPISDRFPSHIRPISASPVAFWTGARASRSYGVPRSRPPWLNAVATSRNCSSATSRLPMISAASTPPPVQPGPLLPAAAGRALLTLTRY